ncbi:MAG TPA: carbamoyl-phosphate synthase domain-containing protein, partial [Paracoccaceae bacterium]|nr:carbamoyl-phosphate synthase domain-containing protein [Paracoccaceae bacterium]
MTMSATPRPTACLALADGTVLYGRGFGAPGETVAELVFNTAMTGYQEIMTDPSYAGQIVTFTFPHVGNVGVTPEDDEAAEPVAAGMVVKWDPTEPSNWRAAGRLTDWLAARGRIGIGGVDTRRLTRAVRQQGAPHAALAYDPEGRFDIAALVAR